MAQKKRSENYKNSPAFSVQDEIKRNKKMRLAGRVRSTRRTMYATLSVLLCVALCILLLAVIAFSTMRVQTVIVTGNLRYSTDEIIAASKIETGNFLPMIRTDTVYRNIVSECAYISDIVLKKKYPDGIEISVTETGAVFAVEIRGKWISLDSELRVMEYIETANGLTVLNLPSVKKAVEGNKIEFSSSDSDKFVYDVLDMLIEHAGDFSYDFINLSDKFNLWTIVNKDAKIIFGDTKSIEEKLILSQRVYAEAKNADSERTLIDASEPTRVSVTYDFFDGF